MLWDLLDLLGMLGRGPPGEQGLEADSSDMREALIPLELFFLEVSAEEECGQSLLDCRRGWAGLSCCVIKNIQVAAARSPSQELRPRR